MTRDELIDELAAVMAEHITAARSHGYAVDVAVAARAQLTALEAAGVRLVPVDPDDNQLAAGMESDSISHPWQALGVYRMMLSRSPYAPPGG